MFSALLAGVCGGSSAKAPSSPAVPLPNGQPRAKDPLAYQTGVVSLLAGKGYCGIFDGDEVVLKRTNDFSEHYKINLSDVYVRTDNGIYRAACYPAAF